MQKITKNITYSSLITLLVLITIVSNAQNCDNNNMGFEDGDFSGWEFSRYDGATGSCNSVALPPDCPYPPCETCEQAPCKDPNDPGQCPIQDQVGAGNFMGDLNEPMVACRGNSTADPSPPADEPRFTIMNGTGTDQNTDFQLPTVSTHPLAGNFSARLGNQAVGYTAECMWNRFLVTEENTIFMYSYAVVLQDPIDPINQHHLYDSPRFLATLTNDAGEQVGCGGQFNSSSLDARDAIKGFEQAQNPACNRDYPPGHPSEKNNSVIYYRDWVTHGINLTDHIGEYITIKFCTSDCGRGGHYGYAYVDVFCQPPEQGYFVCTTDGQVTLNGPLGFGDYKWYQGTDTTGPVLSTEQDYVVPNPQDGDLYTVTFEPPFGKECSRAVVTDTIRVFDAWSGGDTTYCLQNAPDSIFLKATSTYNGMGYNWTSMPGNFSSNEQNPAVPAPSVNTTYIVEVSSYVGCVKYDTVVVNVFNPPVAEFEFPTGCLDDAFEVQFSDRSTGNIVSWQWDFGNGNTSTEQNPLNTYNTVGPHTVTLTVTDSAGCSDVIQKQLSLTPKPTAAFEHSGDCTTPEVQFTDKSTGTITSRQWDFGDGNTSTEQNPLHAYGAAGDYTVTLIVSNTYGCSDTAVVNISTDDLFMDFSFETSCDELEVGFTANGSPSIVSWQWDFGDGTTSTEQNPVHTFNDYGSHTVTMVVTNDEGCSDTLQKPLILYQGPTADFTNTGECGNFEVQFTDNSSGNIETRQWDFGDGATSTEQNPSHTYTSEGDYIITLVVVDSFGCSDTAQSSVSINDIFIDFSFEISCDNVSVEFESSGSPGITTWQWNFGDGNTSTEQSPSHKYNGMGNYTVTLIVTDNFGCTDTVERSMSIDEPCMFEVWFPNAFTPDIVGDGPSPNDKARVRGKGIAELEIRIFDRWGELVYHATDIGEAMDNGWDGTFEGERVDVDSYAWYLTAKPNCCTYDQQEELFMKGSLTLLR